MTYVNRKSMLFWGLLVFSIAFLWELFFTYGFDFFWEDFAFYHLDKEEYPLILSFSDRIIATLKIFKNSIQEFFTFRRLCYAGFGNNITDRPYQFFFNELQGLIFADKAILYRSFKAFVFAINTSILFWFMRRVSLFLGLLGVVLYISSAEVWVVVAYSSDVAIYAQFCVLVSIVLFTYILEKKDLSALKRYYFYFLILIFSNCAVLLKGDGRYLAVLFGLIILLFHREILKQHVVSLTVLLFMEVPLLGYVKKVFFDPSLMPIDIGSHNARPLMDSLKTIIENFRYPVRAMGDFLVLLVLILLGIHFIYFVKKWNIHNTKWKEIKGSKYLVLFALWFLFSFIMIAVSRSFNYDGPADWAIMEMSFFVGPFIVFLGYYCYWVIGNIDTKVYRTIMVTAGILLLFLQILMNVYRMNRFRGGWGNYFCAWHNVEKYIDNISDNALALTITMMPYKPFIFRESNNTVLNSLAVKKEQFRERFTEYEAIWQDLIDRGYIDPTGIIQNKFKAVHDASDMAIAAQYLKYRQEIFEILYKRCNVLFWKDQSPFCHLDYIAGKFRERGYEDIVVIKRFGTEFFGESEEIINNDTRIIDGNSGDLYDRLKCWIGRPSRPVLYLYHFQYKK